VRLAIPRFVRSRRRRSAPTPRAPLTSTLLARYYLLHILACAFPLASGLWLYGFRALQSVAVVILASAAGVFVWRRIGARGWAVHWPHTIWLSLLLAMMLPPHLLLGPIPPSPSTQTGWAILLAAGLMLPMFIWATGGVGFSRVHPLLVSYLLLAALYHPPLTPHLVLHRARAFVGDLASFNVLPPPDQSPQQPWIWQRQRPNHDALYIASPATQRLSQYTLGWPGRRATIPMEAMLRDHMPPLENLVVGGHPGPTGASSAIAIIIGGLFLMYRGLIDFRIPLLIVLVAMAGFLIVPAALMPGAHLDWASGLTFASYELMASPLLLMAFFIATNRGLCPVGPRAAVVFAAVVGALCVVCQLYVSAAYGPYIALTLAGLIMPGNNRL